MLNYILLMIFIILGVFLYISSIILLNDLLSCSDVSGGLIHKYSIMLYSVFALFFPVFMAIRMRSKK